MLEKELQTIQKLIEDEAADREYERAYMMERIQQLEEREKLLCAVISADDPAEKRDIAECVSRYHTTGRKFIERSRYPIFESQGAAATSGNETVICDGRAATTTTVPSAANMSEGRTDGQSELCTIFLRGFLTGVSDSRSLQPKFLCRLSPGMVEEY
jgi:hypothetical protein